jgi:hypothetical protein
MEAQMRSLIVLSLVMASFPALAQRRPDTTAMTCAGAQALVSRAGAVVLGTGGPTYGRFVRHRGFCTPSEHTEPAFERTRDNPACHIGDRCVEKLNDKDP